MQRERNMAGLYAPSAPLTGILAVFAFIVLIFGAKIGAEHIKNALSLCISSVIPSVFPLMVISNLLASGSGGQIINRLFGGVTEKIFGVSRDASVSVLLGFLCGFPIGAVTASRLCESRKISASELCRLLTFVCNPSASFVIFALGDGMLGSASLGVAIYFSVILSAVITGVASRFIPGAAPRPTRTKRDTYPQFLSLFTDSVARAISGSLNVCAYSAFFSALVGILSVILSRFGIAFQVRAALFGFFELISGLGILSQSGSPLFAALSSAAVCSWSGVSVLMQTVAVCRSTLGDERLSFLPMIVSKLIQSALSPLILFFILRLTHFDI